MTVTWETYTDPHKDVGDFGGSPLPLWCQVDVAVATLE